MTLFHFSFQGSPNSSPTCDQLGGLLPYTPPIPSAPENHLMGLYTPTYAAAQSRLFSTGFAPGPPVSSGPESPTSALYSSLAPPPNPASMSPMSPMYNSQAAAAAAAWRAHPPSLTSHQPPCGPYDHHGWHPAYSYAHKWVLGEQKRLSLTIALFYLTGTLSMSGVDGIGRQYFVDNSAFFCDCEKSSAFAEWQWATRLEFSVTLDRLMSVSFWTSHPKALSVFWHFVTGVSELTSLKIVKMWKYVEKFERKVKRAKAK